MQEMMERMHIGPNRNHRDNDAHDDDGIQVRPIPHQRPAPINRPPVYEDLTNEEDFVEGVFGQNVGVDQRGKGRRGVGRGGAGFKGYDRGGTNHMGNVYEGVGYSREESHEYQMKIDLPSFNGHLQIEDFLDWVMEVKSFFDYMRIRKDRNVKLVAYKFKGRASTW